MSMNRLTNIILHNFMNFRHVSLNLQNGTTFFNGMKQSPETNFVFAFKYLLNNSDETSNDDIKRITDDSDTNDEIYVEAQTTSSHGENLIFRKKLKNYEITYEISGEETTRVDFKLHLTRLGFELSNTLLIDSQMIYRLAIMNHSSRGNYIEQYCTPPELLSRYKYAKNKIEILQKEMKSLIDQKKQLKAAEKNEKTKIKSLEAFTELDRNFSKESQDYLLFHLFHNHRDYSELKPKVIEELKTSLNALKGDYATTLIAYRVANENYFYNEKILLKNTDDLRLAYCKKFKLQQEHEKNRQELDIYEMYSTDAFEDLYMKAIHSEIEVSNENCEKLLALKNKYEPSYDEYIYLRKAFNGKNSKFTTLYNILKKLIFTDLDETSESRKFFFHQLDMVKQEKKVFEEKFEALKTQQKELDINTERCKSQSKEMQVKCGIKKNCIARLEDASSTFLRTKKINDRVMLEKLKNKFSHAIVGRLSDLFEVQNPNEKIDVKHYQILERLGKFADAIVVDNRETCVSCEEFLKLHQHECVNVICLSLNNFEALPATEDLVKNYKLPDGVTAIPIENFIVAKHPEIHKLLMSILKPTLVSDSLDNLRIIFAAVDMKIQVTSFEWHMTKKPGSIVEIHQRYNEQYDFDDKTIQTIKENLQKSRLELVELIGEMKYNDLLLVGYNRKKLSLDFHLNMLESLISESDKTIAICQERIKVADENILRLTSIKELSQLKEQFKKVKEILTPFEHEFFKEFLQKYNFDTIDQYETEVKQVFPISIFNYRYNFFKSRLDFYESISMPNDPLFQLKDLDEMRKICDNSKKALDNFLNDVEEIKQKNDELNNNMKDSLKTTLQKRNEYNELEHKIETTIVKLCDELINIQIAVADNFLLLFHTLANCENVPLKNGESLMNLINIPNDVDGDSDFIYENLERLNIDFDNLDDKYKSESDIPKKKIEMAKKLRQLKKSLHDFSLDVTGDVEQLQELTQNLNRLIAETNQLTDFIQEITEEFEDVINERTRRFNACLKVINEEIAKFCQIAMRGKSSGEMKADNNNEPYSSGIFYTWKLDNGNVEYVEDSKLNYEAAFAFLMGLIKYKKQQFVILSDSAKIMLKDFDLLPLLDYLKSDPNLQIIAVLASNAKKVEDQCNYSIMKCQDQCIIKPNLN